MGNIAKTAKQILILTVKVAIAASLVYWLVRSKRLDLTAITQIDFGFQAVGLIFLGAVSVFVGQWLMAKRLLLLLGRFELQPPFSRVLGVTLVGSFCSVVLPGLVGGDAVRALYLFSDAPGRRSHAAAAVVIDRIIGLYSLFLLGAVALGLAWCTGRLAVWSRVFWVCPAAVACLTLGLPSVQWNGFQRWRIFGFVMQWLPVKVQNLIRAIHVCLSSPGVLAAAIALSLINHALVVVTYVLAGILLHDSVAVSTHFILSPIAMVMNAVALTPGGIGLTEGAFSFLYEHVGVSSGATLGLVGRFIQYITFVVGGGVAFLFVRIQSRSLMTTQIASSSSEGSNIA